MQSSSDFVTRYLLQAQRDNFQKYPIQTKRQSLQKISPWMVNGRHRHARCFLDAEVRTVHLYHQRLFPCRAQWRQDRALRRMMTRMKSRFRHNTEMHLVSQTSRHSHNGVAQCMQCPMRVVHLPVHGLGLDLRFQVCPRARNLKKSTTPALGRGCIRHNATPTRPRRQV